MSAFRAAVLGDPIEHSLSPRLHAAGYAAAGMAGWAYGRYRVAEDALEGFLDTHDEIGLSLTMPLKSRLVAIARARGWERGREAELTGVANTLVRAPGREPRVENTDIEGVRFALTDAGHETFPAGRAIILGGGATAVSALVALHGLGVERVDVFVRSPERARPLEELAARLGVGALAVHTPEGWAREAPRAQAVVSTLPGGVADGWLAGLAEQRLGPEHRLLDVAYSHGDSRLAQAWRRAGGVTRPGADMLAGQALVQFSLFAEASSQPLGPEQARRVREAMLALARGA